MCIWARGNVSCPLQSHLTSVFRQALSLHLKLNSSVTTVGQWVWGIPVSSLPLEPEWQPVYWGSNSGPTQALHHLSHLPSPECGLQHNFWLVHIIYQASICPVSSTKATVSKQEATAYGLKVPWLREHHSIDNAFTASSLWRPGHGWGIQNATTANWSRMTVSCESWVWPYLSSKCCHVAAVESFKVTMPNSHRQTVLVITHGINLGLEQS